jgi:predicted GNAT family N-acyltransferase
MTKTQILEIGTDPARRPSQDLDAAFAIRRAVFCVEQGVSEAEEIDGLDEICRQYLAVTDGVAMGTARTRTLSTGGTKIERVAILKPHRRRGIGRLLMIHIMDNTPPPFALNAQIAMQRFYTELGFMAEGSIFEEAGIEHIHMTQRGSS